MMIGEIGVMIPVTTGVMMTVGAIPEMRGAKKVLMIFYEMCCVTKSGPPRPLRVILQVRARLTKFSF